MSSAHDDASKKFPTWLLERLAQGELAAGQLDELRARLAAEGRSLETELAALATSNQEIHARLDKDRDGGGDPPARRAARGDAVARRSLQPLDRAAGARRLAGHRPSRAAAGARSAAVAARAARSAAGSARVRRRQGRQPGGVAAALGLPAAAVAADQAAGAAERRRARRARRPLAAGLRRRARWALRRAAVDRRRRPRDPAPARAGRQRAPPRCARASEIRLPSAYELDDAPGFERFVLVTATQPFPVAAALDAARALAGQRPSARTAPLPLPPAFHQTSVLLQKTSKGTP